MQRFIKTPWAKVIAIHLVLILSVELIRPMELYALTAGPGQPEFEGFTEVDMSQSVDPFTGNFSYQIPLMTVPGPNGGYPLNLVYNSGVGMEDEASWVGLGWSLNPGAISRNVRGLPDDFSGPAPGVAKPDKVLKTEYMKPNWTIGIGASIGFPPLDPPEVYNIPTGFGNIAAGQADPSPIGVTLSLKLYYNSYTGCGYTFGISPSLTTNLGSEGTLGAGANLNFDANDGPSISPNVSFGVKSGKFKSNMAYGMGYSSRQGITGMNFSMNTSYSVSKNVVAKDIVDPNETHNIKVGGDVPMGINLSYAAASGVPSVTTPMKGFNAGFQVDLQLGPIGVHPKSPVGFEGYFNINEVDDYIRSGYGYPAYGLLHGQDRYDNSGLGDDRALMDYDMEKNVPVHQKVPMLPLPVMTHDIYSVTGAEMGGTFRAYRNDAGLFYGPKTSSDFVGLNIGVEFATATGIKLGIDPTVSYTNSRSGKWEDGDDAAMKLMGFKDFGFSGTSPEVRKTEPYFFRFTNEFGVEPLGYNSALQKGGPGAGAFEINTDVAEYPGYSDLEDQNSDADAVEQLQSEDIFSGQNPMKASTTPLVGGELYSSVSFMNNEPPVRSSLIAYKTHKEKQDLSDPPVSNFFLGSYGSPQPGSSTFNEGAFTASPNAQLQDHHIAEFTVVKNNGVKYVYGTPLYNTHQEEVFFAINHQLLTGLPYQTNTSHPVRVTPFSNLSVVLGDNKGVSGTADRAFNRSVTPGFVHSYLLSYIASADYVDVDNNGPSSKDMGYWTKFNYFAPFDYHWRMPVGLNTVNYNTGYASSQDDDKASLSYGEKQMQYLHSVETKTHIAVFYLSPREDGLGVTDIGGTLNTALNSKQMRLDCIRLFAKNDMSVPIKSVHFEYDYSQCPGTANSSSGKLTLRKVYFTYLGSNKGQKVAYEFDYGNIFNENNKGHLDNTSSVYENKTYSPMMADRWGNPGAAVNADPERPYTNQMRDAASELERKKNAVTWNLTRIKLPTGGVIRVDYESDDYAYVQDQPAMQMLEITGTAKNPDDPLTYDWLNDGRCAITDEFQYIFFKPLRPLTTSMSDGEINAEIERYASGLRDGLVYFKAWEKLQVPKEGGGWAYDYVNGYARVAGWGKVTVGAEIRPYIRLQPTTDEAGHYFRTAGFQYLRYSRADLNTNSPENFDPVFLITMVFDIIMQSIELMSGYYNYSIMKGNCKELGNNRPSYLRLYTPDGIKYGGGHRVRKLTVSDNWASTSVNTEQYGTRYYYTLEDGRSSGVACYEPMLGNDENAMKRPHMYGPDNQFSNNDEAFFQEEPFGENFFPAPSVGYSRVTMVNIVNNMTDADPDNEVTKSAAGVQVKTFYTARDYPIVTDYTAIDKVDESVNIPIPIVGSISMQSKGYSQGYYIELNDMHGKPKEELLYDADFWKKDKEALVSGAPYVAKKAYRYFTQGEYVEGASNRLSNTIPIMNPDGSEDIKDVGIQAEMYAHEAEDKNYTLSGGANIGGGVDPIPFGFFITVTPSISYGENSARVIATTKVVNRMGLLKEVFSYENGATLITKNLLFDAETGTPVLTAVTDDYDNPNTASNDQLVYTQSYPAYWYYQGMGPAYRNYRYRFSMPTNVFPNAYKYFVPGDEVLMNGTTRVWVQSVTPPPGNTVTFVRQNGSVYTTFPAVCTVYRSGYRNEQSVMSGKIVSLKKPQENFSSLLQAIALDYSNYVYGSTSSPHNTEMFSGGPPATIQFTRDVSMCNGAEYTLTITFAPNCSGVPCGMVNMFMNIVSKPGSPKYGCNRTYHLVKPGGWTSFKPSFLRFDYVQNPMPTNSHWSFQYGMGVDIVNLPEPIGPDECPDIIKKCMDGILHAEAAEFDDDWDYKGEFKATVPGTFWTANNSYVTGRRGIWRTKRANTYFVEREQWGIHHASNFGQTSLRRDGVYRIFVPFDYKLPGGNANNAQNFDGWRWAVEVPKYGYNPYGFEIENVNALGIYSAALYGYDNSLATAVAKNASYAEIGFDGFEEYDPFVGTTTNHVKHGHLPITRFDGTPAVITKARSHTGYYSLFGDGTTDLKMVVPLAAAGSSFNQNNDNIQLVQGKKYVISFWYYSPFMDFDANWDVSVTRGTTTSPSTPVINFYIPARRPAIDGWRRFEAVLDLTAIPITDTYIGFYLSDRDGESIYLDDIRIMPFDANMITYVYNLRDLKLSAQLDENNYATFYNYDEEGNLVQVKKETERGIMTVQQTRKNVNR